MKELPSPAEVRGRRGLPFKRTSEASDALAVARTDGPAAGLTPPLRSPLPSVAGGAPGRFAARGHCLRAQARRRGDERWLRRARGPGRPPPWIGWDRAGRTAAAPRRAAPPEFRARDRRPRLA